MGPHSRATIERPVDVAKKFTFYREDSGEAQSIGVTHGAADNGLVECIFVGEHAPIQPICRPRSWRRRSRFADHGYEDEDSWEDDYDVITGLNDYCTECLRGGRAAPEAARCSRSAGRRMKSASRSIAAGATGLHGHSNQTFGTTTCVDKDMDTLTSICFRLVVELPNSKIQAPPRPNAPIVVCTDAPPRPPAARPPLVDEGLVQDLQDMGFDDVRLSRRLLFLHEGDIKKCVKELIRMEREAESAPPVFDWEDELKTMTTEFGFEEEDEVCKAALIKCNGHLKSAVREAMISLRAK